MHSREGFIGEKPEFCAFTDLCAQDPTCLMLFGSYRLFSIIDVAML